MPPFGPGQRPSPFDHAAAAPSASWVVPTVSIIGAIIALVLVAVGVMWYCKSQPTNAQLALMRRTPPVLSSGRSCLSHESFPANDKKKLVDVEARLAAKNQNKVPPRASPRAVQAFDRARVGSDL